MGARVLLERMKENVDPLGPENILGFCTGPLTGTGVYGGGRFCCRLQVAHHGWMGGL